MLLRKTCTDFSVHECCGYRVVYVRACNHTLALSQMLGRIYSQWASLDMGDRMGWVYSWKRGGNRRCCLGLPSSSAAAAAKSLQSCSTLCDPIDGSPSGSPVPGILQARTLECVAISFSNAWKWKVKVKSLSRVQLRNPMDCSLPGSSIHGIFQARVLEWVAVSFSGLLHLVLPYRSVASDPKYYTLPHQCHSSFLQNPLYPSSSDCRREKNSL